MEYCQGKDDNVETGEMEVDASPPFNPSSLLDPVCDMTEFVHEVHFYMKEGESKCEVQLNNNPALWTSQMNEHDE